MRALIIEDEALIAMLIEHELHALGYNHFVVAKDEKQPLAAVRRHCPDLITVDDWLVRNTTLDKLRSACQGRAIPAIHISAIAPQDPISVRDAVLPKVFDRQSLRRAIQKTKH